MPDQVRHDSQKSNAFLDCDTICKAGIQKCFAYVWPTACARTMPGCPLKAVPAETEQAYKKTSPNAQVIEYLTDIIKKAIFSLYRLNI